MRYRLILSRPLRTLGDIDDQPKDNRSGTPAQSHRPRVVVKITHNQSFSSKRPIWNQSILPAKSPEHNEVPRAFLPSGLTLTSVHRAANDNARRTG